MCVVVVVVVVMREAEGEQPITALNVNISRLKRATASLCDVPDDNDQALLQFTAAELLFKKGISCQN